MHDFDFLEPTSLAEGLAMLADHGEEALVFAGGTALLLGMRQRLLGPKVLVSLGQLPDLRAITFDPTSGLDIGAMARHTDIAKSEIVQRHYPMLAEMAAGLANRQVRNQGTIGGNLCYADPATDPPSCLIALGGEVVVARPGEERRLAMQDFAADFFMTALEPGEILTRICLPPPRPNAICRYQRHLRTLAEHRPLANVALSAVKNNGTCSEVRLVIGAATPVPQRISQAETFLEGRTITLDTAAEAAELVAKDLQPISDGRGDGEYRRSVVRTAVRRLLADAAGLDWRGAAA